MSIDQENSVKIIYRNFLTNDYNRGWINVDNSLHRLSFLNDDQTVIEAECQIYRHSLGKLKCADSHDESACLVPQMMDAVNAICELYQETKILHPKNRYILDNYLAISHEKIVYVE